MTQPAYLSRYSDVWLVDGVRTPFIDYGGALADVSPTDLGIKVARGALERSGVPAGEIDTTVGGCCAQASFDAFFLPRHIGLYAGVPQERPALLVHRLCGTGFETIVQAGDAITLGKARTALCVGTESMSRNPVAAYTHRTGFRMGQVDFRDFLWEATKDTAPKASMGETAENLAIDYGLTREQVDAVALRSFDRALAAQSAGILAEEILPVASEIFLADGFADRGIRLPRGTTILEADSHIRPTTAETLAKLKPAFGGVQTGGNSSAIVDGAAGVVVASGDHVRAHGLKPLARVRAGVSVGVPPRIMGIGPAPAIRALLDACGLPLDAIGRFEINEAFGAQILAVERELGLDPDRLNVNGGAIAFGHPLGATGVRATLSLAREMKRSGSQYGISSACAGGGQGIALLLEAP